MNVMSVCEGEKRKEKTRHFATHKGIMGWSAAWYWIGLILLIIGLIYTGMVFFKNGNNLTGEDNFNVSRATLLFLAAIAFTILGVYAAGRERHKEHLRIDAKDSLALYPSALDGLTTASPSLAWV